MENIDFKWQKDTGKRTVCRPSWDEYFMKITKIVAERSTCNRQQVGAVIVKDKRILTTGYNGAPAGVVDSLELGCLRTEHNIASGTRHEICRAIHAEQNAIIQASSTGTAIAGSTLYCTHTPCNLCAKMIVNAGIKRVVTLSDYPDSSFMTLFEAAEVEVVKMAETDYMKNIVQKQQTGQEQPFE